MILSGSDGFFLRPPYGNRENMDKIHPMNGLNFGDTCNTLKDEVMRTENKGMA